jgi:hypothetical protein
MWSSSHRHLGENFWEKAHHPSANIQEKSCIYVADVAEDTRTMCAKSDAQPAATENLQP